MGPGQDRTRDHWICSQTRICCQTCYRLRYAARWWVPHLQSHSKSTWANLYLCLSHAFSSMLSIAAKMTSTLLTDLTAIQLSQHIFVFVSCFQIHAEYCREDDENLTYSLTVSQHEPSYICVYLMLSDPCRILPRRWWVPCSQSLTIIQHESVYKADFISSRCCISLWRHEPRTCWSWLQND